MAPMDEGTPEASTLLLEQDPSLDGAMEESEKMDLESWLLNFPTQRTRNWKQVRLFISSTFIDTQAERDVLIKHVIPNLNRKLKSRWVRVVPVDLRVGVVHEKKKKKKKKREVSSSEDDDEEKKMERKREEEKKSMRNTQKSCLNQIDKCRQGIDECPWFLAIRTNRYGWLQDTWMSSRNADHPRKYKWLDKYQKRCGTHVSITSMECMHATCLYETRRDHGVNCTPNMFAYKRHIKNPEDMELELRHVFEFDHDNEINAHALKEDLSNMDKYLESHEHVKYRTYECHYEKGGIKITKEEEGWNRCVGYVAGLSGHPQSFQELVEQDLLLAIESRFPIPEPVESWRYNTIQHEDAIIANTYNFVGRSQLTNSIVHHCTNESVSSNTMMVYGPHGVGKTSLLSSVARRCITEVRNDGGFVFVHLASACPGSNSLDLMVWRIMQEIKNYAAENVSHNDALNANHDSTEDDRMDNTMIPESPSELKRKFQSLLCKYVNTYKEKKFVLIIDGVDELECNGSKSATWWIPPPERIPSNLRIVLSALNILPTLKECVPLPVPGLTEEEGEELVFEYLDEYNKALTENQMKELIKKTKISASTQHLCEDSPLYLTVATEAIRKFGIWELADKYIADLPLTVAALFGWLLDEWSNDYDVNFVQDVVCLIYLSQGGLLENQINDILSYREDSNEPHTERYSNSSFSRLYDSLSIFLSYGGAGYLRFSPAHIRKEIKEKYLTAPHEDVEKADEYHKWMAEFFYHCIRTQLVQVPSKIEEREKLDTIKPAYYDNCLQQLVYHQLAQTTASENRFTDTLRNIHFVRERILHEQRYALLREYQLAKEDERITEIERQSIQQWHEFVQEYFSFISQYPTCAYNMALNQEHNSYVAEDTQKNASPPPHSSDVYPLFWSNKPEAQLCSPRDCYTNAIKYDLPVMISCAAVTPKQFSTATSNLCVFGGRKKVFVVEQESGEVINEAKVVGDACSVLVSEKENVFWLGDSKGGVSLWDLASCEMKWRRQVVNDDSVSQSVRWLRHLGSSYIACGTYENNIDICGMGKIILINIHEETPMDGEWLACETCENCYSYSYHEHNKWILSGHADVIKAWTLSGVCVWRYRFDSKVGGIVKSLDVHPDGESLLAVLAFDNQHTTKQINISSEAEISSIPNSGSKALYNHTGEKILCLSSNDKAINVYSTDGCAPMEPFDNTKVVKQLALVPGEEGKLLIASEKGFSRMLAQSATTSEHRGSGEVVAWCDFVPGSYEEFITLSVPGAGLWSWRSPWKSGELKLHRMPSDSPVEAYPVVDVRAVVMHPFQPCIFLSNDKCLCAIKVTSSGEAKVFEEICKIDFPAENLEPNFKSSTMTISRDGNNLIIGGCIVFDTAEVDNIKFRLTHAHRGQMFACDIHSDNQHVLSGSTNQIEVWNIYSNESREITAVEWPKHVQFLSGTTTKILLSDGRSLYMDNDGVRGSALCKVDFDCLVSRVVESAGVSHVWSCTKRLLQIHDLESQEHKYTFVDPDQHAERFTALAVNPRTGTVIAANNTGKLYILTSSLYN